MTFHNQRDYIFVRHHRYIYRQEEAPKKKNAADGGEPTKKTRARLQELGPRFTLKLKWLQDGVLDHEFGEYEWIQGKNKQMNAQRRKFFL